MTNNRAREDGAMIDYGDLTGKDPIRVELWYPRSDDRPDTVTVELVDVRAADALIITFDHDRNGWRIGMDKTDRDLDVLAPDVEVAFIPAWNEGDE